MKHQLWKTVMIRLTRIMTVFCNSILVLLPDIRKTPFILPVTPLSPISFSLILHLIKKTRKNRNSI